MGLEVAVAEELRGRVRLGVVVVSGVAFSERDPALQGAVAAASGELRERCAGAAPGSIPELAPARRLYEALGLDPTKAPFGNPSSDSARTAVTSASREALVVAYAPAGGEGLAAALDEAVRSVQRFCGGSPRARRLLPGDSS